MNQHTGTFHRLPRAEAGYTLIELMISIVIGLFLIGGLVTLLVTNSINSAELNKTGAQIENGRYAMQLLVEDTQHAGYLGTYSPPITTNYSAPDPCTTAVSGLGFTAASIPNLPVPIYGYDGAAASPSCVANRKAGTDILVVRRTSTTPIAVASAVANEVYFQVLNCSVPAGLPDFIINTNSSSPFILPKNDCATTESIQKYMVHIYFVSSCNVCSGGSADTIPTLKMAEFVAGAFVITPLVEGIDNLQIEHGLDTNNDGAPDCYTSNPNAASAAEYAACPSAGYDITSGANIVRNWSNVVATRIHILARNVDATAGWVDNRTYDLGPGVTITPNDAYKRHVYSATARLFNPSGQRETP